MGQKMHESGRAVKLSPSKNYVKIFYNNKHNMWEVYFSGTKLDGYHEIPEGALKIQLPDSKNGKRLYFMMADNSVQGVSRQKKEPKQQKYTPYLGFNPFTSIDNLQNTPETLLQYTCICDVVENASLGRVAKQDERLGINFFLDYPDGAKPERYFKIDGAKIVAAKFPKNRFNLPVCNDEIVALYLVNDRSAVETKAYGIKS